MKEMTIGVLGGMGTYATINLFRQYADIFTAKKEWERPRIIIDNRCTMPSRVRAYFYGENKERLINEMCDSVIRLIENGCTHIIIGCNTAHLFLPQIYQRIPLAEKKIINIISNCADSIESDNKESIYLIGSEATIKSGIYQRTLSEHGIGCEFPTEGEYEMLRKCIEAVKQNCFSDEVKNIFCGLIGKHDACILGCTELPVLADRYGDDFHCKIYDPVMLALKKLKEEYDNG